MSVAKTTYEIYTTGDKNFNRMVEELLNRCTSTTGSIIQLTFFGAPSNNKEYIEQLNLIRESVKSVFKSQIPLISYVAQKPLTGGLILEVGRLLDFEGKINYKSNGGTHYIETESNKTKSLIINILPSSIHNDIKIQSKEIFTHLENIFHLEGYDINSIIRQWNYIERITDFEGEHQHYQSFNDARSHFYSKTNWDNGYPAATGIGTQHGGIMIDVIATMPKKENYIYVPLDNKLQVAAYDYSQDVLLGAEDKIFKEKTTPKFERAKAVTDGKQGRVYISGTAAIRGEDSLTNVGIEEQTRTTIENIKYLISKENLKEAGIHAISDSSIDMLRIYLKNAEDTQVVKDYMDNLFAAIPASYLLADVCREELLIEIEGIASFTVSD
ncbi:MAG: Rid family hydrolase [Dysgonomonas sp.]